MPDIKKNTKHMFFSNEKANMTEKKVDHVGQSADVGNKKTLDYILYLNIFLFFYLFTCILIYWFSEFF